VVDRMLTRRTVALASLLVIAQLMQNGKQETSFGKVIDGHCVHGIVSSECEFAYIFTWRSVTLVEPVREW
jgi:hypothetical protein